MILAGEPNTDCFTFPRQTWGVSRAQGYRLLKKAWQEIKNDIVNDCPVLSAELTRPKGVSKVTVQRHISKL